MRKLNKALLLITLSPLLLIIFVAAINRTERLTLRFLIWTTPEISLSTSLLVTSSTSFLIGYLPYLVFSRNSIPTRRKVKVTPNKSFKEEDQNQINEPHFEDSSEYSSYLERDIRDPSPTLTVPFKVIRASKRTSSSTNFEDPSNSFELDNNTNQNQVAQINKLDDNLEYSFSQQADDWQNNLSEDW